MTDGLLAVDAVVALSMTVFVPVVEVTVLELLETVFELLETVLDDELIVLLIVEFDTVSVANEEDDQRTNPTKAIDNGRLTITLPPPRTDESSIVLTKMDDVRRLLVILVSVKTNKTTLAMTNHRHGHRIAVIVMVAIRKSRTLVNHILRKTTLRSPYTTRLKHRSYQMHPCVLVIAPGRCVIHHRYTHPT